MVKLYFVYIVFMSVSETLLYKTDKERSKRGAWRVKESALLGIAIFGGAAGALISMVIFHHKTRHWYFWAVNIISSIFQFFIIRRLLLV